MIPLPDKIEFRLVLGAHFQWKPYVGFYKVIKSMEISWLGVYMQFVWVTL